MIEPTPEAYGYRVLETATHYIDVVPLVFGWRVHTIRKDAPSWGERWWRYEFLDDAVEAVLSWEGTDHTEPAGWVESGQEQAA